MPGYLLRRPEVFCDLQSHANRIALHDKHQAVRFLEACEATFDMLRQFPEMGALAPDNRLADAGVRQWRIKGFNNYLIFYRTFDSNVEIIRVVHSRQSWDDVLSAL